MASALLFPAQINIPMSTNVRYLQSRKDFYIRNKGIIGKINYETPKTFNGIYWTEEP